MRATGAGSGRGPGIGLGCGAWVRVLLGAGARARSGERGEGSAVLGPAGPGTRLPAGRGGGRGAGSQAVGVAGAVGLQAGRAGPGRAVRAALAALSPSGRLLPRGVIEIVSAGGLEGRGWLSRTVAPVLPGHGVPHLHAPFPAWVRFGLPEPLHLVLCRCGNAQ